MEYVEYYDYITGYRVEGKNLIVEHPSERVSLTRWEDVETVVPYSKDEEENVLEIMKEQFLEDEAPEAKVNMYARYATGALFAGTGIVGFNYMEHPLGVAWISIMGLAALCSIGYGYLGSSTYRKGMYLIKNKEALEQVTKTNIATYATTSRKNHEIVNRTPLCSNPITFNNFDELKLRDLKKMVKSVKEYKQSRSRKK